MLSRPLAKPRGLLWQPAQLSANSFAPDFPSSIFCACAGAFKSVAMTRESAIAPENDFTENDFRCIARPLPQESRAPSINLDSVHSHVVRNLSQAGVRMGKLSDM